jgi:hypothetical protein
MACSWLFSVKPKYRLATSAPAPVNAMKWPIASSMVGSWSMVDYFFEGQGEKVVKTCGEKRW